MNNVYSILGGISILELDGYARGGRPPFSPLNFQTGLFNDLAEQVQSSEMRLFAGSTILYVILDNLANSQKALNDE